MKNGVRASGTASQSQISIFDPPNAGSKLHKYPSVTLKSCCEKRCSVKEHAMSLYMELLLKDIFHFNLKPVSE
jgi:hypothetical protein